MPAVVAGLVVAGCTGGSEGYYGSDAGASWDGAAGGYDAAWSGAGSDAGVPPDPRDPTDPGGDSYDAPGTNPWVRTDHDPFSTFAADVDTASYDIFVRDVEDGLLPAAASVRLEEYVNFFDYDYPTPEPGAEVPFAIDLAAAHHPMGRDLAVLRVGIQAAAAPELVKVPANLVFLVDVSGSMQSADKLPLVQVLLRETLDVLEPTDTVSIVTYASDTGVRLRPTPVSDRSTILRVIDGLTAGGSTAGGAGIRLAYEQAEAGFIEGGINHVILCTDGDFNVGVSSTDELVSLIEEKRATGVTLTALGFGRGNLNDAMMEQVSNAGNGIYAVITSEDHARRYAREQMLDTLHHVAKDMKIQVEFNPEHVVAYRLLGYEDRAIADMDFRVDTVDAGEVSANHRVTALYELVLEGQMIPDVVGGPPVTSGDPVEGDREIDPADLVLVKVRYKDVGATETDPAHEVAASLTPEDVVADLDTADDDFMWASAIAAFAEILKGSPYADMEDLPLVEAITTSQRDRDPDRARFVDLFTSARFMLAGP